MHNPLKAPFKRDIAQILSSKIFLMIYDIYLFATICISCTSLIRKKERILFIKIIFYLYIFLYIFITYIYIYDNYY